MNAKLNIPADLQSTWVPVVERQFDLHLAPLRARLRRTQISFRRISAQGGEYFETVVSGRLASGEDFRVEARHSEGHVAVADVFSRLRRDIQRRTRMANAQARISETGETARTQ